MKDEENKPGREGPEWTMQGGSRRRGGAQTGWSTIQVEQGPGGAGTRWSTDQVEHGPGGWPVDQTGEAWSGRSMVNKRADL